MGGSNVPSSQKETIYNSDTSFSFTISETIPVKNGYRFLGWTTKGDTPAIYRSGEITSLSEDLTLYAFWQMTEEGGEDYPG